MNKNNIILIPVYKQKISDYEEKSLRQCFNVLRKHTICLVTYEELNCDIYISIAKEYNIKLLRENFSSSYFTNINGYNKILISKSFYVRYKKYNYMLIYQLDAYVFYDALDEWCAQGFDYIGAPWFENYQSYEDGAKLWKVGNGGFSLRNIRKSINILSRIMPVFGFKKLWELSCTRDLLHQCFYVLKSIFGWHNTMDYLVSQYVDQEDLFWTQYIPTLGIKMKIPTPKQAAAFSFERSPAYLYKLNNQELPFGCHAWKKYDYDNFWSKYIN